MLLRSLKRFTSCNQQKIVALALNRDINCLSFRSMRTRPISERPGYEESEFDHAIRQQQEIELDIFNKDPHGPSDEALRKQFDDLKDEMQLVRKQKGQIYDKAEQTEKKMQHELDEDSSKINSLQNSLAKQKTQISKLEKENSTISDELKQNEKKVKDQAKMIGTLQKENQKLKDDLSTVKQSMSVINNQMSKLKPIFDINPTKH
eukprot:187177_1